MLETIIIVVCILGWITISGVAHGIAEDRGWGDIGWAGSLMWPVVLLILCGASGAMAGRRIGRQISQQFDPAIVALTGEPSKSEGATRAKTGALMVPRE